MVMAGVEEDSLFGEALQYLMGYEVLNYDNMKLKTLIVI